MDNLTSIRRWQYRFDLATDRAAGIAASVAASIDDLTRAHIALGKERDQINRLEAEIAGLEVALTEERKGRALLAWATERIIELEATLAELRSLKKEHKGRAPLAWATNWKYK